MEAVKSNFIKGKWVIPNLITPVKEKMLHSLKIQSEQSELSTTYLSSILYKPGKINSELHPVKSHFLKTLTANSVEAPYLNQIISQLL